MQMEERIIDSLKTALEVENDLVRLKKLSQGCKIITKSIMQPKIEEIILQHSEILVYLFTAQPFFGETIDLILSALTEKLKYSGQFVENFYHAATQANDPNFLKSLASSFRNNALLIQEKTLKSLSLFTQLIINIYKGQERMAMKAIECYKSMLRVINDQELMTRCFQDILYLREKWSILVFSDPYFDREVEEILISKNIYQGELQAIEESDAETPKNEQGGIASQDSSFEKLSPLEKRIKQLEDWLLKEVAYPQVTTHQNTISMNNEFFKNSQNLEILLTFLFNPTKYPLVASMIEQNPPRMAESQMDTPTFRQQWQTYVSVCEMGEKEKDCYRYRAYRTMLALTNAHNHFLVTTANPEYFSRAFSLLYESLKGNYGVMLLVSRMLVSYLQFVLYYEPDITIYLFLYYNLPFRFLLYLDFPEVGQFLLQISCKGSVHYRIPATQVQMVWRYFSCTEFFVNLVKASTLNSEIIESIVQQKAVSSYKPNKLGELLVAPDMTPFQTQKTQDEYPSKKLVEEVDPQVSDIDLVKPILRMKIQRGVRIFEQLVAESPRRKPKKLSKRGSRVFEKQIQFELKPSAALKRKNFGKLMTTNFGQPQKRTFERKKSIEDKSQQEKGHRNVQKIIETIYSHDMSNRTQTTQADPKSKYHTQGNIFRIKHEKRQVSGVKFLSVVHSEAERRSQTLSDAYGQMGSSRVSMISRYRHIVQLRQPLLSPNSRISLDAEDLNFAREGYLYPSGLSDYKATLLDLESHKDVFRDEQLQMNENYSRGCVELLLDILHMNPDNDAIYANFVDLIQFLGINYLLKLKIPSDEQLSAAVCSGKLYNAILSKQALSFPLVDHLVFSHFALLCQVINSTFLTDPQRAEPLNLQSIQITFSIKLKTFVLVQTFSTLLHTSHDQARYLKVVPTSVWHLLLIYLAQFKTNQLYIHHFATIFNIALVKGDLNVFNKIVLKLNCLNFLKTIMEEIYSTNTLDKELDPNFLFLTLKDLILIIYTQLQQKAYSHQKKQIELMVSWQYLAQLFQNEIQTIENDQLRAIFKTLDPHLVQILESLFKKIQEERKQKSRFFQ